MKALMFRYRKAEDAEASQGKMGYLPGRTVGFTEKGCDLQSDPDTGPRKLRTQGMH